MDNPFKVCTITLVKKYVKYVQIIKGFIYKRETHMTGCDR